MSDSDNSDDSDNMCTKMEHYDWFSNDDSKKPSTPQAQRPQAQRPHTPATVERGSHRDELLQECNKLRSQMTQMRALICDNETVSLQQENQELKDIITELRELSSNQNSLSDFLPRAFTILNSNRVTQLIYASNKLRL